MTFDPRTSRILKQTVKWLFFAVVAGFVARELAVRFGRIPWGQVHLNGWWLLASVGCLCISGLLMMASFRSLVSAVHSPPVAWPAMCGITWVPRLGKYIPGKAASVAGVIWLLGKEGVPLMASSSVVLVRSMIAIVVSFMVAAPVALWPQVRQRLPMAWLWCLLLIAAGAVILHPRVLRRAGDFLLRRLHRPPLERLPRLRDYLWPLVLCLGQLAFFGLGLFYIVRAVGDLAPAPAGWQQALMCISASALATAMGFVAVFAPAGLGVQEGVLLLALTPLVSGPLAAVMVVLLRLVQTATDVAMALAGMLLLRRKVVDRGCKSEH